MMRSTQRRSAAVLACSCAAWSLLGGCAEDVSPPSARVERHVSAPRVGSQPSLRELLQDGDILLHRSTSSQSAALMAATGSAFTHVGLAFRRAGSVEVLEAVQPVRWTALEDWLARGRDGKVVVLRLADPTRLAGGGGERLRSAGERFLGRPYDGLFEWSDEKIYCSELVFKAYREAAGVELGELRPMGSFDLTSLEVRRLIEARAAGKIDLDEPVVAPHSLLADDDLVVVYSDDPEVRSSRP